MGSHAAVAAQYLGKEYVDGFLNEAPKTDRERAFRLLVSASHVPAEATRRHLVEEAATVLSVDEVYHANAVISLFNFYNKFVDLNGVSELTAEGYQASGVRLSTAGYAPPAKPAEASRT